MLKIILYFWNIVIRV